MIPYRDVVDLALAREPGEKVTLAAEAFLHSTVFSGAAITYRAPTDARHSFLFARGYSDDALSHLSENFVTDDPMYRRAVADSRVLTWRDGVFAQGRAAREWLSPAGYRNGFSVPIRHPARGEIGSVHANCYAPDYGDQQLDAATALAELLTIVLGQKLAQQETRLTARELNVVRLIAADASNPEIAAELCVSRRTVATHVENILRKLGARTRVGIVVRASRLGLL